MEIKALKEKVGNSWISSDEGNGEDSDHTSQDDLAEELSDILYTEEPEIYLYPQSQRILISVFREIADEGNQVIYSTHSSWFVDIGY